MTESSRKRSEDREKDLRLAMLRIEHGRAHTKVTKISIAAVAYEAGVSAALIHNHYPEDIRTAVGRSTRAQRDAKQSELKASLERNRELREEIKKLELLVANLASENEVMITENRELRAAIDGKNIGRFPKRN